MTIRETLHKGAQRLKNTSQSPELDVEVLLSHVLKKERSFLFSHPEELLSKRQEKIYENLLAKRASHHPVAYLVGHREFFGINLNVNRSTLIPQPDTEVLVETVLEYLKDHPEIQSLVDVGTGSGALAIALAKHAPTLRHITALDTSTRALALAKKNAGKHGLSKRMQFIKSNLLSKLSKKVDCIVANLPYLSEKEYSQAIRTCPEISFEPKGALVGGKNGLLYIEKLLKQVPSHLTNYSAVFLEIGDTQACSVRALGEHYLPESLYSIKKDLAGRDRVVSLTHP